VQGVGGREEGDPAGDEVEDGLERQVEDGVLGGLGELEEEASVDGASVEDGAGEGVSTTVGESTTTVSGSTPTQPVSTHTIDYLGRRTSSLASPLEPSCLDFD
jgi:hypothetical protein